MLGEKTIICSIALFLAFGFAAVAPCADQPESKTLYLKNGQEIKCDKCWPDATWSQAKEFQVWYQIGKAAIPLPSAHVDIAKTFGDDFANKQQGTLQEHERQQKLQKQAEQEARTAMHIGDAATGGGLVSTPSFRKGDIEITNFKVVRNDKGKYATYTASCRITNHGRRSDVTVGFVALDRDGYAVWKYAHHRLGGEVDQNETKFFTTGTWDAPANHGGIHSLAEDASKIAEWRITGVYTDVQKKYGE